jgi:hypothetical protein
MPKVLTTNAVIRCPHAGVGRSIATDSRWSVDTGTVLLDGDAGEITDCEFFTCQTYRLNSMRFNATWIGSRQVMLVTDFILSNAGFPLTVTELHEVIDDSTPTPVPPGQTAPPLPPELQDVDVPTVTATPFVPGPVFKINPPSPPALSTSFSLSSRFPRGWALYLASKPTKSAQSLTDQTGPDVIVQPAGGSWTTTSLTVDVVLKADFLTTLSPGDHELVLTGINHRGRSGHARLALTVSA